MKPVTRTFDEDTPRTNVHFGAGDGILWNGIQYVPAKFARELERELPAGDTPGAESEVAGEVYDCDKISWPLPTGFVAVMNQRYPVGTKLYAALSGASGTTKGEG